MVQRDIRAISSIWIVKNLSKGITLGIENIPIYQMLPDVALREFYQFQYGLTNERIFNYEVISSDSENLPDTILITNDEVEKKYILTSEKIALLERLKKENYIKIKEFKPNFEYFNILNNEFTYFKSGLIFQPATISVYLKRS